MGGQKNEDSRATYFTLSVPTMIKGTCALPLFAMAFCVLWSLVFDFDASTRTHCKVWNCLPTISAVIGGFTPQRYVWRICITLHAPQRLMVAAGYYRFHTAVPLAARSPLYRSAALLASLLNGVEVLSLVGLSMISSTENYALHENLFICFMACGLTYMLLTIILMRWGRFCQHWTPTPQEVKSVRYKTGLFLFKLSCFALAVYLFFRHNAYCEPGVYSLFAALEYVVCVSNIAFHGTLHWDFGQSFVLGLAHQRQFSKQATQ
ncbi:acyltransferase PGAP2-like [Babylonia areolata]|uniref:acyltransferase PGAP2-like n=1 Tax=Babylonia areolata TaxID=304850 RepID=UPI003FD47732